MGRAAGDRRGYRGARGGAGRVAPVDRRDSRDGRRRRGSRCDNQFNRAWQARRQPGSSFKIYDYTAAIDRGIPAIDDHRRLAGELSDGRRHAMVAHGRRPQLHGSDHAARRAHALAQHRRGEARRARGLGPDYRLRAPDGRDVAPRGESLAGARIVGCHRRSIRRADIRRLPTKGCTSIRRRFAS